MRTLVAVLGRGLLLLPLLLFVACSLNTIAEVQADPHRFENKDARLGGVVVQSYGVLNYGLYEIEDRTGKMFVVSERGVPSQGARVEVKGKAVTAFSLAGVNYGTVLMETSRKLHR